MATFRLSDGINPELWDDLAEQITVETMEKSPLLQSGAVVESQDLNNKVRQEGTVFHVPEYVDLDDTDANVSSDDPAVNSTPRKNATVTQTGVKLKRNVSFQAASIVSRIQQSDPLAAVVSGLSNYWTRQINKTALAIAAGVFADNDANDSGDMSNDVSGGSFTDGVTNFTKDALWDTLGTLGDSESQVEFILIHSRVYRRARQLGLIDYQVLDDGLNKIELLNGKPFLMADNISSGTNNVYETYLFGRGALQMGIATPENGFELERTPQAGNGGGVETLYSRNDMIIHPTGFTYTGASPVGGPLNAATTNNLAAATSWDRVYPERKQIKMARLVTREA